MLEKGQVLVMELMSPEETLWDDVRCYNRFGPDWFSRLLDTNRQAKFIHRMLNILSIEAYIGYRYILSW